MKFNHNYIIRRPDRGKFTQRDGLGLNPLTALDNYPMGFAFKEPQGQEFYFSSDHEIRNDHKERLKALGLEVEEVDRQLFK